MVQQKFLSFLEDKGGFDSIVVHASTRDCGQSESLAGKADVLGYIAGVDGSENCGFLIAELVLVQVADNHEKQRSFCHRCLTTSQIRADVLSGNLRQDVFLGVEEPCAVSPAYIDTFLLCVHG